MFDVLIVGASLAGASLAIRLGTMGLKIALIDKDTFPRRKPCGEGLSQAGAELLRELGAFDMGEELSGYRIIAGSRVTMLSAAVRGVERERLDAALVSEAASHANVELLLGAQARDVRSENGGHAVHVGSSWIRGRKLVLADGVNSFLAARLENSRAPSASRVRYGLSFVLEGAFGSQARAVTIVREPWGELFCTPVSASRMNVALLGYKQLFSELPAVKDRLAAEVEAHTGFRGEVADEPKACGRLESSRRPPVLGGVLLIGDSCENLDPVGGMGMTHALGSAKLAAEALGNMLTGSNAEKELRLYAARRERLARPLRRFTGLSALFVKRLSATPLASAAGRLPDGLIDRYLRSGLPAPES